MTTPSELSQRLRRLSKRLGFERFLQWWLRELADMVPLALSATAKVSLERRVLVHIDGSQLRLSRLASGTTGEVGRVNLASLSEAGQKLAVRAELEKIEQRPAAVVLCLPPQQVLRKTLNLPLATEENLRQVLAFEMDRHTPFKAEQVYFDYRAVRADQHLQVSLLVAPRVAVDQALRQLASWGLEVDTLRVDDAANEELFPNVLALGQRQTGQTKRLSQPEAALAAGAALLLGIALILPIWQKRETVLALHPVVAKAHEQAEKAENLRRQLEGMLAEYNYLLNKKREVPPVVAVLDDLTRVLPNDSWVQQFDLKGKEVQVQGETASSSKLVALVEQSKTLHGASFKAPLTKGMSENSERFHLAAETRPLPRAETEFSVAPQIPPQALSQVPSASTPDPGPASKPAAISPGSRM